MNPNTRRALWIAGAAATAAVGTYAVWAYTRPRYAGIKLKRSILIDRPADDLYAYWRDLENLPKLADILESVTVLDDIRSRWTVIGPADLPIQWEARIIKDIPGEMIGWQSVEGAPIETAGYVRFERAVGSRGTLVRLALEYDLPAGRAGAALATLFGKRPGAHVQEMLRRLKQVMETGESAISEYPEERFVS